MSLIDSQIIYFVAVNKSFVSFISYIFDDKKLIYGKFYYWMCYKLTKPVKIINFIVYAGWDFGV